VGEFFEVFIKKPSTLTPPGGKGTHPLGRTRRTGTSGATAPPLPGCPGGHKPAMLMYLRFVFENEKGGYLRRGGKKGRKSRRKEIVG